MRVQPAELLRDHLLWLGSVLSAEAASLFVPSYEGSHSSLFVHGQIDPAVPELESVASAQICCERFERAHPGWTPATAGRLRSREPRGLLIHLPMQWPLELAPATHPNDGPQRRRSDRLQGRYPEVETGVLVGLRLASDDPLLDSCEEATPLDAEICGESPTATTCLLALLSAISSLTQQASAAVDDPVSGLPGRAGLIAALERALRSSRGSGQPLAVLLINPDEFFAINDRFGREAGDEAIREITARLRSSLRHSDRVAKYGGAIFAAVLEATPLDEARQVARKSLADLREGAYLRGAARLGFSVGIATFDPAEKGAEGVLDLLQRADQALYAAKRAGGGRAVCWQAQWRQEQVGNQDRLSGIFTGNSTRDYRNMALLLDTIGVIAATSEYRGLARQVVQSLFVRLRPDRVAIIDATAEGRQGMLTELVQRGDCPRSGKVPELDLEGKDLVDEALRRRAPVRRVDRSAPGESHSIVRCAVPLVVGEQCLGCLYLDGDDRNLEMDNADLIFLKALASQLAVATDRARLTQQESQRQEQERRQMQTELSDLRRALREAKLVYRSQQMEELLAVARRVAPTDATVLILGESGTGKELLARSVHEISPRHKKPLTVVDCAAIPSNLIESELFGHERGAFTGADRRKVGRLAEAAGSTVVLDEIAELPLDAQSRLLRFVQERQLTPVGGARSQSLDVRVIASTNRDLATEVAQGRFREDLYHRLNVVRLAVPPLRQRPGDILHLAEHFLQVYGLLYRKKVRLTPEAEALLLQYRWPGNVRELQNCIEQAVILEDGGEIDGSDLGLPLAAGAPTVFAPSSEIAPEPAVAGERSGAEEAMAGWIELRRALADQIAAITAEAEPVVLPLGGWLADDLVLAAVAETGGVARRAAHLLAMPASTVRRRSKKARSRIESGLAPRPHDWTRVRHALSTIVKSSEPGHEDLLARAERTLLEEILSGAPDRTGLRSELLGVSIPTYLRRVDKLAHDRPPP